MDPTIPPPAPMADLALTPRPGPAAAGRPDDRGHRPRPSELALDPAVAAGLDAARAACEQLGRARRLAPGPVGARLGRPQRRAADRGVGAPRRLSPTATSSTGRRSPSSWRRRAASPTPPPTSPPSGGAPRAPADWERWFAEHGIDLVLEPTLPIVPYERGPGYDRGHAGGAGDPMIALTALWDLTGMPVAALPGDLGGRRLADRPAGRGRRRSPRRRSTCRSTRWGSRSGVAASGPADAPEP